MNSKGRIIQKIIHLRDIVLSEEPTRTVEKIHYDLLVKLLILYFTKTVDTAHFKKPDMYASNVDFAYYINDHVLDYIYYENADDMHVDWRDMYIYIGSQI